MLAGLLLLLRERAPEPDPELCKRPERERESALEGAAGAVQVCCCPPCARPGGASTRCSLLVEDLGPAGYEAGCAMAPGGPRCSICHMAGCSFAMAGPVALYYGGPQLA